VGGVAKKVADVGVSAMNHLGNLSKGTGALATIAGHVGVTGTTVKGVLGAALPAAAIAALPVLGPVGIALTLAEMGFSGVSAVKSHLHMVHLEKILQNYMGKEDPNVRTGTLGAIAFACLKKNKKRKRKGLGCIPVLGAIGNTVYSIGRRVVKNANNQRGVDRRTAAHTLWYNMLLGDPAATEACRELLGKKTFGRIRGYRDGDQVLKKKLRSI
jgi:hypothetical protein